MNDKLLFDVAHLLAGSMLVLSFLLLYQDRITAVINVFALQAMTLALSVAWQALVQDAPHLLVTWKKRRFSLAMPPTCARIITRGAVGARRAKRLSSRPPAHAMA